MNEQLQLSAKSLQVLKLIAEGHSYSQIVESHPDLTYHDVFFAAEEAVWLNERLASAETQIGIPSTPASDANAMAKAKLMHPRAYAPWSESEDAELRSLHDAGKSTSEIAVQFQRQPSAIRSRLTKLGLNG